MTPRTAGFNTVNTTAMTENGLFVLIALMFVGGAAGSTAGGIKIQTFSLLCFAIATAVRGGSEVEAFGRRVPSGYLLRAIAVALLALGLRRRRTGQRLWDVGREAEGSANQPSAPSRAPARMRGRYCRVKICATRSRLLRTPVLSNTAFRCCCTVSDEMESAAAISSVGTPCKTSWATCASRSVRSYASRTRGAISVGWAGSRMTAV